MGLAVNRGIQLNRVRDNNLDTMGVGGVATVEFTGQSDLGQVPPVVVVGRAQAMVIQDQLLVRVRLVGESTRDSAT